MKKFLCFVIILFSFFLHAQTYTDALLRIAEIEMTKQEIVDSKTASKELKRKLNKLYQQLENDVYSVSSYEETFNMKISTYNVEKECWFATLSGNWFYGALKLSRTNKLLYSSVLEKRYVKTTEMTEQQRNNYEFYVSEFENKLQKGEKLIYAKYNFKITHWDRASTYRLEPQNITFYRNAKTDRLIHTASLPKTYGFYTSPVVIDCRTEDEIERDKFRVAKILRDEQLEAHAPPVKKEDGTYKTEYTGRRAIIITGNFDFPEYKIKEYENQVLQFDTFDAFLYFPFNRFFYGGLGFGADVEELFEKSNFHFCASAGIHTDFGTYFAPFAELKTFVTTSGSLYYGINLGFDMKIGHILLINSFNFLSKQRLEDSSKIISFGTNTTQYGQYNIGIGISW